MNSFRGWVQGLERDLFQGFRWKILLGFYSGVQARDLRDELHNTRPGFSFLALHLDRGLETIQPMLQYCAQPSKGCALLVDWFLEQLALVVQLTWGMPTREPELLSICWQNGRTRARNVYIFHDLVMMATDDPKTRDRLELVEQNLHFLPPQLSNIVVQYLAYIHPLVVMLPRLARGLSNTPWDAEAVSPREQDRYLFQLPGCWSKQVRQRVSRAIVKSSAAALDRIPISTAVYWHIAIAIAKQYLPAYVTPEQLQSLGALGESVYTWGLIMERLEAFRHVSHAWQQFVFDDVQESVLDPARPGDNAPNNNNTVDKENMSIWLFLQYYLAFRMLVCRTCQSAVLATGRVKHVKQHLMQATLTAEQELELLALDIAWLAEIHAQLRAGDPPDPFPELQPAKKAFACTYSACPYLTHSIQQLRRHAHKAHGLLGYKRQDGVMGEATVQALNHVGEQVLYIFKVNPPTKK
ncbi:hypothetical protein BJX63DRAFT_437845 [Aspergillus granulosus]|uniref:C2H2-type domain-containing protein n=1 Tax=Aspergillus granulosus TaxID=176169 RepID=A0ABR4GTR5_9EURO